MGKKPDCLDYFHKLDSQKHDIKNVTQLKYALESYTPCKFCTTNSGAHEGLHESRAGRSV